MNNIPELGPLGGSATAMIDQAVWVITVIFVVAVIGILAYFLVNLIRYKYRVVIISKRGDGSKIVMDRGAMIKTSEGVWYLKLLKQKSIIKPVDNKYIGVDNTIFLRHLGEDNYYPFRMSFNDKSEKATIEDLDLDETLTWLLSFKKLVKDKYGYKDFLEQYLPVIAISAVMFIFLIGVYFMSKNFTEYISVVRELISAQRVAVPAL